jgi:uncharacterized membrane protein
LFNDVYLGFFLALAIWLMVKQRYILSGLALNVAISLKAGGLLLLPAFLAMTVYGASLSGLMKFILLSIAFQYSIAYPFATTDQDAYFLDSRLFGHSGQTEAAKQVGAQYDSSVFWVPLISRETYYDEKWLSNL